MTFEGAKVGPQSEREREGEGKKVVFSPENGERGGNGMKGGREISNATEEKRAKLEDPRPKTRPRKKRDCVRSSGGVGSSEVKSRGTSKTHTNEPETRYRLPADQFCCF